MVWTVEYDAKAIKDLNKLSRLPEVEGGKPAKQKFKNYPTGFFHTGIAEVQTAEGKLRLFVAISRQSGFAVIPADTSQNFSSRLTRDKRANIHTAAAFLKALVEAMPY